MLAHDLHRPPPGIPWSGIVVVCSPGGGIPRGYFDLVPPGRSSFSLAAELTSRGHAVAAVDLAGTAPHDPPGDAVGMTEAAAALARTTRLLATKFQDGSSAPPRMVGLGHSLGAAVTVAAAAEHRCFEAIAVLGQSPAWRSLATTPGRPRSLEALRVWTRARLSAAEPDRWAVDRITFPPPDPDDFAYREEVPDVVRRAVRAGALPVPRALAVDYGIPEPALAAAAEVEVPVLLAFGEPDASSDPETEPRYYPRSTDVHLVRLPGSAHLHLASRDRTVLLEEIADWIETRLVSRPPVKEHR